MGEGPGELCERMWRAVSAHDWDGMRACVHPDFVQEWPQSGERIEGIDDAIAINENFPGGLPEMRFRRTTSDGGLGVLETQLTYADGSVFDGVTIVQLRDGKIVREIDYFAEPFRAPEWRAQWVKRA